MKVQYKLQSIIGEISYNFENLFMAFSRINDFKNDVPAHT